MRLPVLKKIIVAFDGSQSAIEACSLATLLARNFNAAVRIVGVLPATTILSSRLKTDYEAGVENSSRLQALKIQAQMEKYGIEAETKILRSGDSITRALIDYSEAEEADLIVAGTRGLGTFRRMILGSVSGNLLNQATCPVLVFRKRRGYKIQKIELQKILVATDGSDSANRAVQLAVSIAKNSGALLVIAHVVYMPPASYGAFVPAMDRIFDDLKKQGERILAQASELAIQNSVNVETRLIDDDQSPVSAITEFSEDGKFDLVVLGTRGMGRVRKAFLGSVANGVAHYANCSVLVTR